ncbi:MAG TPA: XrtA/PEP-CTERM system exopolysaccharide export protein [Falsiroseomonas sp.]|nr:XrtA/PEP-CTERM system exopolysaccharide export protein [Falsiroseomonas sp.]
MGPAAAAPAIGSAPDYVIGPGDSLSVFVYRSPELSMEVPVRPDGRISLPLVADINAAGLTPVELSRQLEERLREFVREPNVTVIVRSFVGPTSRQIRIVGEAAQPRSIPFREGMTVLDALIESGGLTRYAAGNRARLIRREGEAPQVLSLRLNDLLRDGDISQDMALRAGDTLVIPQGWF